MRRKYFGLAIAAFATFGPMQAWGGDREIAEQIIQRLKTNRDSGILKDFTLDMKVDQGVVLFRGNVSEDAQKALVLEAADGIEGVAGIVDEVNITDSQPTPVVSDVQQQAFSFREALATDEAPRPVPGQIRRTAAVEPSDDAQVVSAVVAALSQAKQNGRLKGFGVDVKSNNGVLQLTGRASSRAQRDTIITIAENVPGVAGVREAISVPGAAVPRLPEPPSMQEIASAPLQPLNGVPARAASNRTAAPTTAAPYRMQAGQVAARPVSTMGAPMAGQPVPMAPYAAAGGAPRYDSPNLPNYAWPGYAAHPNYAALTYPQQYSPSAWPYIGPFYPYPQVPLGWRKVSLEWDDGWWFLDFTDR